MQACTGEDHDDKPLPARRARSARNALAVGGFAALPLFASTFVATCAACIGAGAAAGTGVALVPSAWWLLLTAVVTGAAIGWESLQCRRCGGRPQRRVAGMLVSTLVAYAAVALVIVPVLARLKPSSGGGATLP